MSMRFSLLSGCMLGFEWCESEKTLIIDIFILCILIEMGEENDGA